MINLHILVIRKNLNILEMLRRLGHETGDVMVTDIGECE